MARAGFGLNDLDFDRLGIDPDPGELRPDVLFRGLDGVVPPVEPLGLADPKATRTPRSPTICIAPPDSTS